MKKALIATLLLFFVGLSGCKEDKFFELQRPPEFPWQSVSEFELSVIDSYQSIFVGGWDTPFAHDRRHDFSISDLSRGITRQTASVGDVANYENWNFSIFNAMDAPYAYAYRAISNSNAVLQWVDSQGGKPTFPGATPDDAEYNIKRIIGELYFTRAWAYYFLVKWYHPPYDPSGANDFRKLPLRTKPAENLQDGTHPTFGSTKEIYDLIVADLNKAKSMLPEKYIDGKMNTSYKVGRATRFAAAGMLARVDLSMGKFDAAQAEIDYIINSGQFQLEKDPIQVFNKSEALATPSTEAIMYVTWASNQSSGNGGPYRLTNFNKTPRQAKNGGSGADWSITPFGETVLSYSALRRVGWFGANDYTPTKVALSDKRFSQVYYYMLGAPANNSDPALPAADKDTVRLRQSYYLGQTTPIVWINKFYRSVLPFSTWTPLMRLAELYNTRAMLRLRKGDKQGAADDLNQTRSRAWDAKIAGTTYEASTEFINSSNISEETILQERIRELAGEGDYISFITAFRLPVKRPLEALDRGPSTAFGTEIKAPYSALTLPLPNAETIYILDK